MRRARLLPLLPLPAGRAAPRPRPPAPPPAVRPPAAQVVPPPRPVAPPATGFRAPQVLRLPGLEGVIEQNAADLARQFGNPRLDVREGDMRKLQFGGEA